MDGKNKIKKKSRGLQYKDESDHRKIWSKVCSSKTLFR